MFRTSVSGTCRASPPPLIPGSSAANAVLPRVLHFRPPERKNGTRPLSEGIAALQVQHERRPRRTVDFAARDITAGRRDGEREQRMVPTPAFSARPLEVGLRPQAVRRVQCALDSQALAPFEAAQTENAAPILGAHPRKEAVHTLATADFGLPGSLHAS